MLYTALSSAQYIRKRYGVFIFLQDSGTIVQDGSTTMTVVDRDEVDARPLLRVSSITINMPPVIMVWDIS